MTSSPCLFFGFDRDGLRWRTSYSDRIREWNGGGCGWEIPFDAIWKMYGFVYFSCDACRPVLFGFSFITILRSRIMLSSVSPPFLSPVNLIHHSTNIYIFFSLLFSAWELFLVIQPMKIRCTACWALCAWILVCHQRVFYRKWNKCLRNENKMNRWACITWSSPFALACGLLWVVEQI